MFGKRGGSGSDVPLRQSARPGAAPAPRTGASDAGATGSRTELFPDQGDDLRRADRGDRSLRALQARSRRRARGNPRHRARDRHDQEPGAVDRRAGGSARRHLQRRARLRAARAAARARRHRRHHGQRAVAVLHRGRRKDPAHQRALPRQRAADEHLPAHRQPGRPAGRRSLADLRRPPARRLARQRHRAAAGDRRRRAHHPQVQEGQADARPARAVRRDLAAPAPRSSRSSAAFAATCSSPAAPAPGKTTLLNCLTRYIDARRARHHLRGRGRAAAPAAARGAARDPPAEPRGRRARSPCATSSRTACACGRSGSSSARCAARRPSTCSRR